MNAKRTQLAIVIVLVLLAGVLTACGGQAADAASTAGQAAAAEGTPQPYSSTVLVATYQDALPANMQLALGTLKLEGTADAVTPDQAAALKPLWQALQSGAARTDPEVNAVLKQIEGKMKAEQLAAIAAMQLTMQDVTDYAQANGLTMAPPAGAEGMPPGGSGRQPPAWAEGMSPGSSGGQGSLTEEQRAAMRATADAGGGPAGGFGQGGPAMGNLTDEQRQAFQATAEAGGQPAGGRPAGGRPFGGPRNGEGGSGFLNVLAKPLVDLLTQRAAQ